MANKNNIQSVNLNGTLNLNKYKCEIKNFDGFNEKNSSMFGGVLTPYFQSSYSDSYFGVNGGIYHVNSDYSYDKIALYNNDKLVSVLPKYSVSKLNIDIRKNVLAFEFDSSDKNIIHLFVEGETVYQYMDYNIESGTVFNVLDTFDSVGSVTQCYMIDQNVVYYDTKNANLYISNRHYTKHIYYSNNGSPICSFNRLPTSFNIDGKRLYLISYCGRSGRMSVDAGNVHNLVVWFDSEGHIHDTEVTLAASGIYSDDIGKFAPKVFDDNPIFYNVTNVERLNQSTSANPITSYLMATPSSYDSNTSTLTVACSRPLTVQNNIQNSNNKCSVEITPYFCSVLAGNNANSCNCYFDSNKKYFVFNGGYVESEGSRYLPFGHKVDISDASLNYKFSLLINYGSVSNLSVSGRQRTSNIGSVVNEWNLIDEKSCVCVDGYKCLFKNSDNTLSLVEIKMEAPKYKVILDRYIFFSTPHWMNIYDTKVQSFYHAFNDYNNRIIPCEKSGDLEANTFPTGLLNPFTYLGVSAINANMEVSNINFSSIQYNPFVVQHGRNDSYNGEFKECGEIRYNEKVDFYLDASNTATSSVYKRSFTLSSSYYDNELRGVVYPITSNGNIMYSANLFSEFVNSYSNKDFIINGTVGYPLTYINNNPTLNYYFLSGIDSIRSAFILQGINYINTDKFIFQIEYSGDVIGYSQALVTIDGFKFVGNTTKCAFYYSDLTKTIYGFYGDRSLTKLVDCSDINIVKGSYFNPKEYKTYVVTDKNVIVIDENTMYTIDIPNVTNVSFANERIILNFEGEEFKSKLLEYHSKTNSERIPLKLKTQYYGMGNNIKSVVDCVYIRLLYDYGASLNVKGDLKLSVSTLTECGRKSEEKTFTVMPSDWDKETKTAYLRYQPKWQECVGMEVSLESPFALASLDFGFSSDGTAQVSKMNV